jgi:murein L,D-transpeptidase YafK
VTGGRKRATAACALGALAALAAGCAFFSNPLDFFRPVPLGGSSAAPLADDDDHLAWAESERYVVVIRKSCRTLDVYEHGNRIRSFPAVFGLNGKGSKLYEGDLRTPTGLYTIADKRPHPRWRQFLLLDYPNLEDLHRYWVAMESGRLPQAGDHYAGIGGAIGIHGTDKPSLNEHGVDWTWGCISIANPDVDDLARLVPVGTLVLIED